MSQKGRRSSDKGRLELFAKSNLRKILSSISADDTVLDVGGWAQPLNRANHVIDIMPYETRGVYGSLGEGPERFTKETWVCRDLCAREPFPFGRNEIDYVFCSHTLEDLRDPIYVCSEIARIGKRGYIEVPSWLAECSLGIESRSYAGWYHHRWIVEIHDKELTFFHKPHSMHSRWSLRAPRRVSRTLEAEELASYLFWSDGLSFREKIFINKGDLMNELEARIRNLNTQAFRFKIHDKSQWIRNALAKRKVLSRIHRALFRS